MKKALKLTSFQTGKTTTVVETIYQLGKKGKKILLVAPSNDAADILVERLSSYFPPSELRRILAYSRSIESVPQSIRDYSQDSLQFKEQAAEIMSAQIVVSTVNLAARFSFWGIPRGHFEVLCVDEAGHATEPEVVSVASSLMDFKDQTSEELNIIIKSDVHGSSEAIKNAVNLIKHDEVKPKIILSDVGMVTETDVNLAKASNAVLIAFNVKPSKEAKKIAEQSSVKI